MAFAVPGLPRDFNDMDGEIGTYPDDQPYNSGQVGRSPIGGSLKDQIIDTAIREGVSIVTDKVEKGAKHLLDKGKDYLNNKGKKSNGKQRKSSNDRNGGSNNNGNNSSGGGGGGRRSSSYGAPNRAGTNALSFNSGIPAGLTVNRRLHDEKNPSLYTSSGWFFIITDPTISALPAAEKTEFEIEVADVMYPVYEQIISNTINRWAGQYINKTKFLTYIKSVSQALQVYYSIDNVLAYSANNSLDNVNIGMEHLRNQLSASVMVQYNLLRETLENSTIPPNLVNYLRWFMQSYRLSEAPHSSIIRLNPGAMFESDWTVSTPDKIESTLKSARSAVLGSNEMMSFMNRAFPSWTLNEMPPSAKEAVFDKNFLTFWHNQTCSYYKTHSSTNCSYSKFLTGRDSYLFYKILERDMDVDGAIFASNSSFFSATEGGAPTETVYGMWHPYASVIGKDLPSADKRETLNIKFYNPATNQLNYVSEPVNMGNSCVQFLPIFTGTTGNWSGTNAQFGDYGFVTLQNVNPRMQEEAFNNTVRLLLDPPKTR